MELLHENISNRSGLLLTIVVPVYNEILGLDRLHQLLHEYLQNATVKSCVLFVDDGSNDGSVEKIKSFCAKDSLFSYISFDQNYGLSAAIKAGIDHVVTPFVGYIDADLQTNPNDFNLLLPYVDEYEIVIGIRSQRMDSFSKKMSSRFANWFRRLFTNDGVIDTGCPLKIIRTDFAKAIPMFSGLHRFLPAMIMLQKGRVFQVEVTHYPRIAGQSKFNVWNRLLGPMSDCFAYLWMKRKYINYKIGDHGPR